MEIKKQSLAEQLKGKFDSFDIYQVQGGRKVRKLDTVFYLKGTTVDEVLDSEYKYWLGVTITATKGRS